MRIFGRKILYNIRMKKTKISVLHEDDFLLAVNKPPYIACVPGESIPLEKSLLGQVQQFFSEKNFKPYLLHRLDRETSGVILFGKYERDRSALEGIFRHPDTKKIYVALVKGVPRGHVISAKLRARHSDAAIPAETHFKILEIFSPCRRTCGEVCAFLEIEIKTGRKHQIRQHFSGIGHPVVMDREYGDFKFNRRFHSFYGLSRQFLHAARICFPHPLNGQRVEIEAPLPQDLLSCVKKIVV